MTTTALPTTLTALLQSFSLDEALENCTATLRKKPDARDQHLLRLDLLCLKGAWERASLQMETCARLDASLMPHMALYRGLINCETAREAVFAGTALPGLPEADCANDAHSTDGTTIPDNTWPTLLLRALREQALGHTDMADALREQALGKAPECAGHAACTESALVFEWITDSDTRLGPVLEAFVQDAYVWLPYDCVQRVTLGPPQSLRDLVWQPARLDLASGPVHAFLPARYPGSGQADDELALGRKTRWTDVGRTGVCGLGQKVWCTDAGDLPLCDVRMLELGEPATHTDTSA